MRREKKTILIVEDQADTRLGRSARRPAQPSPTVVAAAVAFLSKAGGSRDTPGRSPARGGTTLRSVLKVPDYSFNSML
jgi:hypothetical protein